eukprot:7787268-Pyramimonas_sp.AAC.1
MSAAWSDYYKVFPRDPTDITPAWWTSSEYKRRSRRGGKVVVSQFQAEREPAGVSASPNKQIKQIRKPRRTVQSAQRSHDDTHV